MLAVREAGSPETNSTQSGWQLRRELGWRAQEKTELEEQRVALAGEVQNYRKKIKQLEDDLLFRLSNSQACRQSLPLTTSHCVARACAERCTQR